MSFVKKVWDKVTGQNAADKASQAANRQADWQQQGLDYLMESEELPMQLRDEALMGLAGAYGLPGGTGDQAQFIESARQSPIYGAIMGGLESGEDAIMRNAAATGGLRSGNVQDALARYNTELENQALLQSYNQQLAGLGGLANQQSMAPQIAQQYSNIGQTYGQGAQAAAQAKQSGIGSLLGPAISAVSGPIASGLGGLASSGIGALAGLFSDKRLKDNITFVESRNGHNWYTWDWNDEAESIGMSGRGEGVIADEVEEYMPEAIMDYAGYKTVDYAQLEANNG